MTGADERRIPHVESHRSKSNLDNAIDGGVWSATNRLRERVQRAGVAVAISGVDGSGKTTLCKRLLRELAASGVPVKHVHLYQWYVNLSYTPLLLLYNRHIRRRVLILDRTIYDNLAVAVAQQRVPVRLFPTLLWLLRIFYPAFDYRFVLTASLSEITLRRPETDPQRHAKFVPLYRRIAEAERFTELRSDETVFSGLLDRI